MADFSTRRSLTPTVYFADEQIRACAEKGGVVGMIALGYFIGPDPGGDSTIETHADHIEHAVSIGSRR